MSSNASSVAPSVSSSPASRWPHVAASIGGVALGLGALLMGAGYLVEGPAAGFSIAVALVTTGLMALGGLALGVGWVGLAARGEAGFGAALGALAVPATIAVAIAIEGQDVGTIILRGLIQFAGLTACAAGFAFGLGDGRLARLSAARLFAGLGVLGFGANIFFMARQIDAPVELVMALCVAGFVGIGALGLALAAGVPALADRRDA